MSVLGSLVKPIVYVSLPVYALTKLSNTSPLARYYIRLGLYLSTLGLCSIWGVVCSVVLSLAGRRFDVNYVIARSFYAVSSRLLDIHIVVEGEEHLDTHPAVLIGNHQSMLDILYIGRILPLRSSIMAKKELQWMPLLGQFMTLSGAVFVDRGNNARAVRSLAAAAETMRVRRTSLWLFPEGTRTLREQPDMRPFKKGAFHTAVQAGVPIVPVICENYWRLYHKGVFEKGTFKIRVLPPIPTTGLTAADVPALTLRVHDLMVATLREISQAHASTTPQPKPQQEEPAPSSPPSEKMHVDTAPAPTPVSSTLRADPEPEPAIYSAPESRAESRASTVPSEPSSPALSKLGGSENGAETEEDEGMVLVGRPS